MCPVSRNDLQQPKGKLMSLDTAGAVAARLKHEFNVEFLAWGNWGEPLVHPEMVQLAAAFARVGFKNQFLSSSLSAKFDTEAFILSDITHLDISISGMTAEVYNKGHKHGNWDLIKSNMESIAEARRQHPGRLQVDVRWHRYKYNECQLEKARAWCEELGFSFKPYFAHLGGVDALHDYEHGTLPADKAQFVKDNVFLEFINEVIDQHKSETSCPMFKNLIIHPDGKLLHCCALMASHQDGTDFLTSDADSISAFKNKPNKYCGECLSKGWAGFTHAPKTEVDLAAIEAPLPKQRPALIRMKF